MNEAKEAVVPPEGAAKGQPSKEDTWWSRRHWGVKTLIVVTAILWGPPYLILRQTIRTFSSEKGRALTPTERLRETWKAIPWWQKAFVVLFSPFWFPVFAVWWLVHGGVQILDETFWQHRGTVKENLDTGEIYSIYYIKLHPVFFFILLLPVTLGYAWWQEANDAVATSGGIVMLLTIGFCFMVVLTDIPWWGAAIMFAVTALVYASDGYVAYWAKDMVENENTWVAFLEDGILDPTVFAFVRWCEASMSTGMYLLIAATTGISVFGSLIYSLIYGREKMDESYRYPRTLFKSDGREPIFNYKIEIDTPDIFEVLFGCSNFKLTKGNQVIKIKYVLGLGWPWWLGRPANKMIDRRKPSEVKYDAKQQGADPAATKVRTAAEEMGDDEVDTTSDATVETDDAAVEVRDDQVELAAQAAEEEAEEDDEEPEEEPEFEEESES